MICDELLSSWSIGKCSELLDWEDDFWRSFALSSKIVYDC